MTALIAEAREARQIDNEPQSESSHDLASLAQNSRTLEQKLSSQNMDNSGQYNRTGSNQKTGSANDVNQYSQGQSVQDGQYDQGRSAQSGYSQGQSTQSGQSVQGQSTQGENYGQGGTRREEYSQGQSNQDRQYSNQNSGATSNQSGTSQQTDEAGSSASQHSNATLIPVKQSQDGDSETHKHDTTIHRTVNPAVVHETIRPIETNIVTTNMTVHHHIHHYVHRIQAVIVSSDEEERWVHDFMGQGMQPHSEGTMYRQMGNQGGLENEVGRHRQTRGVEGADKLGQTENVGRQGYSHGLEQGTGPVGKHQSRDVGENVGRAGKHSGNGACTVCGSSGNVLKGNEGGKTHNGGICRVCGNNYDEQLSQGISDMNISGGSGRSNELSNRV